MQTTLKSLLAATLLFAAAVPALAQVEFVFPRYTPSPEEVESEKLATNMAKVQPQLDDAVHRWLDATLQAQVQPVQPVKAQAFQPKPSEDKCRMVPDKRSSFTLATGFTTAEATANAKGRVPPNCSATGKTLCDRYADMHFASNKDFLAAFKKHMREPKWKYSCSANYTCPTEKRVCDGGPRLGAGASRQ